MKSFKKIVFGIFIIIIFSLIGGYIYFNKKFSPPENYLKVSNSTDNIPIKWFEVDNNAFSGLLLPVKIEGVDFTFYMQLDFGSPITMFYKNPLESIKSKFPKHISMVENSTHISLNFKVKNLKVSSDKFKILDYGNDINFENQNGVNIIGTIGTDLLEKRIIDLDLKKNLCSFKENVDEKEFSDFQFEKRRILLPAKLNNMSIILLYDSGTSGYELITDKENWNLLRIPKGEIKTEKGNSWGKELQVITAPANLKIQIGNANLNLSEITYIEGTSKMQNFLMKASGMEGMIGNKIFLNHRIIINCKAEKFIIK